MICGAIFQSKLDHTVNQGELPHNSLKASRAKELRERWSEQHRKSHPESEHKQLRKSGRAMTPEAAHKLAAFGIIPITDMVTDNEVEYALMESSAIPTEDAQS